jgi:Histidinol-phosphate/aromatic aminotransferase and cobyric acid decarboxylase
MKKNWFELKVKEFSAIGGYQKPELNEKFYSKFRIQMKNYVLSKQFQNNIVSGAIKNSDVREYPLGGVERLIKIISKFVKVPTSMIGIGNGSDQILDLILSNFASKQTKVLTSNPTFGFFEERCKLYSIPLITIPFSDDMKLNVKRFS